MKNWTALPSLKAICHSFLCGEQQDWVPYEILNVNWFFLSTYSSALSKNSIKFVNYDFALKELHCFFTTVIFILYFTHSRLSKKQLLFSLVGMLGYVTWTLNSPPCNKQTKRHYQHQRSTKEYKSLNVAVPSLSSIRILGWKISGSDN